MGFRRFSAWAAVLVVVALVASGPALSALADDFGSKSKYHWGTRRVPFTLRIGDNVDSGWDKYLKRGAKRWSNSGVVKMRIIRGNTNPQTCQLTEGQVEVCNADYGATTWLGITDIFYRGKHITQARVRLNDYYFDNPRQGYDKDDQIHTMCHELGHTLGLPHPKNDRSKSCMNDNTSMLDETLKPIRSDFVDLENKYDHRDRDVTVGRSSASGAAASVFDPATIPNVEVGEDGTHTVTETRLPDGSTVVTFITWVEEGE